MSLSPEKIKNIVEAALLASGQPLSLDRLLSLFLDEAQPTRDELHAALASLAEECGQRGVELKEVGSGFRFQVKQEYAEWVARLWEERPARYSRALLETLALIAYRQPITRGEIEGIRGVSVSSNLIKTLQEREWIKVVGHRDVPGRPAMYATTRQFLDYFSLRGLAELPTLAEIRDIDSINAELDLVEPGAGDWEATGGEDEDAAAGVVAPAAGEVGEEDVEGATESARQAAEAMAETLPAALAEAAEPAAVTNKSDCAGE